MVDVDSIEVSMCYICFVIFIFIFIQCYNDLPNLVTIFKFKISRNWDEFPKTEFQERLLHILPKLSVKIFTLILRN
jgi:hypothetical protein